VAFQNSRLSQHCLHLNAAYAKTSASAEIRSVTMRLKNICCEQALDRLYLHRCFRSFLIMKGICISDLKKQAFTAVVLRHTPSLLSSDKSGLCQNSFNTLIHMGSNFRRGCAPCHRRANLNTRAADQLINLQVDLQAALCNKLPV
jgi:hypothetical protein